MSKYKTITFDEEGTTFNDMYHFYACKDLRVGFVAIQRVPYYCDKCNYKLRTFYGFDKNNYCHDCNEFLYMDLHF